MSAYMYVYISICLSSCSTYQALSYFSVCLSLNLMPSVRLSVCSFVCLSVSPFLACHRFLLFFLHYRQAASSTNERRRLDTEDLSSTRRGTEADDIQTLIM